MRDCFTDARGPKVELICECLDNFGDAGISWRLAKLLNEDWRSPVRLFIDQPNLVRLWAQRDRARLKPGGLTPDVRALSELDHLSLNDSDLLIAMLGTSVPARLRQALAGGSPPWIRYEYLTAEDWIDQVHGLASIKPADAAREWFYYPGFTVASGGLLRERGLIERLDAFSADDPPNRARREQWLRDNRLQTPADHFRICLFGYPDQASADFLAALKTVDRPLSIIMSESLARGLAVEPDHWSDTPASQLLIHPWLDQPGFDLLLSSCDLNIVRGEDSWLRAQWAGKPMLWQPYRQPDGGHLNKLDAFLDRLLCEADTSLASTVRRLMAAVNGQADPADALADWFGRLPAVRRLHLDWRDTLTRQSSLTERLALFCKDQLQLRA